MAISNGSELLLAGVHEAHFMDRFLAERLPTLSRRCGNADLRAAIARYVEAARDNLDRTELVLDALGARPDGSRSPGLLGLLDHAEDLVETIEDDDLRDLALGAALDAIEQFAFWRFTTLKGWTGRFPKEVEGAGDLLARNCAELEAVRECLNAANAAMAGGHERGPAAR